MGRLDHERVALSARAGAQGVHALRVVDARQSEAPSPALVVDAAHQELGGASVGRVLVHTGGGVVEDAHGRRGPIAAGGEGEAREERGEETGGAGHAGELRGRRAPGADSIG